MLRGLSRGFRLSHACCGNYYHTKKGRERDSRHERLFRAWTSSRRPNHSSNLKTTISFFSCRNFSQIIVFTHYWEPDENPLFRAKFVGGNSCSEKEKLITLNNITSSKVIEPRKRKAQITQGCLPSDSCALFGEYPTRYVTRNKKYGRTKPWRAAGKP